MDEEPTITSFDVEDPRFIIRFQGGPGDGWSVTAPSLPPFLSEFDQDGAYWPRSPQPLDKGAVVYVWRDGSTEGGGGGSRVGPGFSPSPQKYLDGLWKFIDELKEENRKLREAQGLKETDRVNGEAK